MPNDPLSPSILLCQFLIHSTSAFSHNKPRLLFISEWSSISSMHILPEHPLNPSIFTIKAFLHIQQNLNAQRQNHCCTKKEKNSKNFSNYIPSANRFTLSPPCLSRVLIPCFLLSFFLNYIYQFPCMSYHDIFHQLYQWLPFRSVRFPQQIRPTYLFFSPT